MTLPKTILLATKNPGKLKEYQALFEGLPIELKTLNDVDFPDVDETGTTFFENAKLKADSAFELTGMPTLAEDSGLCVDALGGAPGIYTARYGGMEKLLEAIKSPEKSRKAHYHCCLAYKDSHETTQKFEGNLQGSIATEISGKNGFGFDPVFIPEGFSKTVASLDEKIVLPIRHRTIALQKFIGHLKELNVA
jgi:non-canonical purine NTP pyrophosphatase (RdgB/HAM1 family)